MANAYFDCQKITKNLDLDHQLLLIILRNIVEIPLNSSMTRVDYFQLFKSIIFEFIR